MKRLVLVLLGMFILVGFANVKDLSEFEMFDKVIELQTDEIAKLDWIYVLTDYSIGEFVEVE